MTKTSRSSRAFGPEPLWFKNAIIYEIPVRAYADSNADGIGDFNGLISKLDYLQDLGVTALWLLPFYPSPLRDGGYDISDYTAVHPMYGVLNDFKRLLKEAHARGLRVITELVINHTSKEHPWFQRARQSPPNSKWRNYYVWSEKDSVYSDTRIIFRDFETSNWTWDSAAGAFYWHRFYSHQPDLNFDNPEVHRAVLKALDFWLDMGVDGLRLDAIPYLYEREGTNCENLPETHQFLKKLRKHIDDKYEDRMLLAEANQWPEDAAAYFGDGDECHMNFHFPLMPRMFMAVQLEDSFPIVDILRQTPEIPDNCQWATFLRNHDELTLEMVTDEDRDYMYRSYAQDPTARINLGIRRRLAPLLGTRAKVELMNGLLFSLPGTPVLYYGDEIGMGDNIYLGDRDGVRTPMQWSADRNAGFSLANPQKLYLPVITDPEYRYEAVNVQAQTNNASSLLWWMKRTIALRKHYPALASGKLEMLQVDNSKILAFLRLLEHERIFVVANLSRFHQWVELDLSRFEGFTPVELSGAVRFPAIEARPYRLSLAPYGFLWFVLEPAEAEPTSGPRLPELSARSKWTDVLTANDGRTLSRVLASWIIHRRWYRGKARRVRASSMDVLHLKGEPDHAFLMLHLEFTDGDPHTYFVPVHLLRGAAATEAESKVPHAAIARVTGLPEPALLVDSLMSGHGARLLSRAVLSRTKASGVGELRGFVQPKLKQAWADSIPAPKAASFEQTNSAVLLGEDALLKVYRQVETGTNSEQEIGEFLTSSGRNAPVAAILGGLTYASSTDRGSPTALLALLQEFVPNQGTAWEMTLGRLDVYFETALSQQDPPPSPAFVSPLRTPEAPQALRDMIGPYLNLARLLGRRVAEMHQVLSTGTEPGFAPEAFTTMHQQSIYQWTRTLLIKTFGALRKKHSSLPKDVRPVVTALLDEESRIDDLLRRVTRTKLEARRIRCHGDLHLGQVLYTGDDFVIIDFEGEPARPLNERSYKRCPLRDVMGIARSFSYAGETALRAGRVRATDVPVLRNWARAWEECVTAEYVRSYLETAKGDSFLPDDPEQIELLLSFYGMEKAIYEMDYEMNNRPEWLPIPIAGMEALLRRELGDE